MKNFLAVILLLTSVRVFGQDTTRLSMLFLGDIMQHDSQISDAWNPATKTYDYAPSLQYVKPYTRAVDVAIGNLELTLAGRPFKGYPQFSAPDELLYAFKDIGMDVLVTANNHCVDRGKQGLERTIMKLDSMNMLHTGTFRDEAERKKLTPLLIKKNGFNLALLNYTYGTNGLPVYKPNIVNLLDTAQMAKDIAVAKQFNPDLIIVFTHWGTEYQSLPSAWQKNVTEFCFRKGVSIVIGAHPHVIQPMEWHPSRNQLVGYSLGNFVSGQRKRYTDGGAMVRLELKKFVGADGKTKTEITNPTYLLQWVYRDAGKNYYVLPVPTAQPNSSKYIKEPEAASAYQTFVEDSRALLNEHNINIKESMSPPVFEVEFEAAPADTLGIRELLEERSDIRMLDGGPTFKVQVGPFTLPDAMHMIKRDPTGSAKIRKKE